MHIIWNKGQVTIFHPRVCHVGNKRAAPPHSAAFGTLLANRAVNAARNAGRLHIINIYNSKHIEAMNIKPLADRVLVLPAPAEEKVGGIIIPDTAKEKPLHGTIVAAGKGTKDEEMILKEGDEVLYGKYSGTELEHEGTKYLMMRQSDVLAVIEK